MNKVYRLWLPSLLGRLTLTAFVLSLLTLYLYFVGNLQGFTDSTLFFLFKIESIILTLSAFIGVSSTLVYLGTIPFRRHLKLNRVFFTTGAAALSIALYLIVALLQAFMAPYSL